MSLPEIIFLQIVIGGWRSEWAKRPARSQSSMTIDRAFESLVNLLASRGFQPEGYCSAERFLSADGLSKSACIVTDVKMPAMSGLGLLHFIRSVNIGTAAIIATSGQSSSSGAGRAATSAGHELYRLSKP
jgi:CheY-like chemotaxis protein